MKPEDRSAMIPLTSFTDCIAFMLTHYDVWSATPKRGAPTLGARS